MESSMSNTTVQPQNRRYIRVSQQKKKLRWPENGTYRATQRTQAAQQQQQCEFIHTCVYKQGRFPQTRDLWRKSASTGYRVGRVSLHAVSRWSRSPGCCGYISWCVILVSGGISFSFSFSLLRTHTAYCKYEATLPHVPLYWYKRAYRVPLSNLSVRLSF